MPAYSIFFSYACDFVTETQAAYNGDLSSVNNKGDRERVSKAFVPGSCDVDYRSRVTQELGDG